MESIKRARCEESVIYHSHPLLVKDVLFSAILVAANEALLKIAEMVGAPDGERTAIRAWIERGLRGLEGCWDPELELYLDYDLWADKPLKVRTVAGFAPLVAGHLSFERLKVLLRGLDSPAFSGHPGLRRPLPPSTSPEEEEFHPRSYWRGPAWPVINWPLWGSLERVGESERAEQLRQAALMQLADGGFGEYFDPFTGRPLGSANQSWTAAIALDWLASESLAEGAKAA